MKSTIYRITLALALVVGFGMVAGAIVSAKTLQLRVMLSRKQLLNYRLSTDILRSRLRILFGNEADFSSEIRVSVLESGVMNADLSSLPLHVSALGYSGIAATNVVRLMNFKPILRVDEDRRSLLLLQYAFFLERKKRYGEAVARYRQVLEDLNHGEDRAFAMLHAGYCLSLLGQHAQAIEVLGELQRKTPHGHFGEAAGDLLSVLREHQERSTRIRATYMDPRSRAVAFHRAGQYAEALTELQRLPAWTAEDRLIAARSLEETGNVARAAEEYRKVNEHGGGDAGRQAVRRLLFMGEFLSPDPAVTRYAKIQAERIGETKVLEQLREARQVVRAPVMLAQLGQKRADGSVATEAALAGEVRRLFPDEPFVKQLPATLGTSPPSQTPADNPPPRSIPKSKAPVNSSKPSAENVILPKPTGLELGRRSTPPAAKERTAAASGEPERAVDRGASAASASKKVAERVRRAPLLIAFLDGRVIPAEQVKLENGRLQVALSDSTVTLPFSIVSEVRLRSASAGGVLVVRFPGTAEIRLRSLARLGPGKYSLIGIDGSKLRQTGEPAGLSAR